MAPVRARSRLMRALTGAALTGGLLAAVLQSPAVADGGSPAAVTAARPVEQAFVDNELPATSPGRQAPAAASAAVACEGDGVSGKRVQLLYIRGDADPDRFNQLLPEFRARITNLNFRFASSSDPFGGHREVRFVQNPSTCEPTIDTVVLPQAAVNGGPDTVRAEMDKRGYNNSNRKYLSWVENTICGITWRGIDDRPDQGNSATGTGLVLSGIKGCWDNRDVDVHELTHSLGAVNPSAKYSTPAGHCYVYGDLLCYDDHSIPNPPGKMIEADPDCHDGANLLDCTHDMYFNPNPAPGSYLATHWNVANSPYLTSNGTPLQLPTGNVGIVNAHTGYSADIANSATGDGTRVMTWGYKADDLAQRWNLERLSDGRYRISPLLNNTKALDFNNDRSRVVDGTSYFTQLWNYAGTDNQKWTLRPVSGGKYEIVGYDNGCLTSPTTAGTVLGVWQCNGNDNQRWRITL